MEYPVNLTLPEPANPRYADLSLTEYNKRGYRVIGGDKGDIYFKGYTVDSNITTLYKATLNTGLELTPDEAQEIAEQILQFSYDSIGVETVEHS